MLQGAGTPGAFVFCAPAREQQLIGGCDNRGMELLSMALAWLLAGFVDAIVGGGGLILVPALFAILPTTHPTTLFGITSTRRNCRASGKQSLPAASGWCWASTTASSARARGSFLLFLFVRWLGYDFLHASASAKLVNTATNLAALTLFATTAHVWWQDAAALAVVNIAGSLLGTRLALRYAARFVRVVFLLVVADLILKTGWDAFAH